MFFGHQEFPSIALANLKGFEEDTNAAKIFERRFWPGILGGVAVIVLGFGIFGLLALRAQGRGDASALSTYSPLAIASFVLGFVVVIAGCRQMSESLPISPRSGQQMEPFRLEDTIKEGKHEVVYVCRASHTYFRRVYSEKYGG